MAKQTADKGICSDVGQTMKKGQLKSETDDDFEGNAQRETLVDNIIAEIDICYPIYYDGMIYVTCTNRRAYQFLK